MIFIANIKKISGRYDIMLALTFTHIAWRHI